jgi:hypothetical protein
MKVIKPGKLSVLTRCYEQERRFYMGFSVVAFVPLGVESSGPILLPEVDLWKFAAKHVPGGALDVGIPKPRAEFILIGKAYTPGGAPQPSLTARAKVGGLKKSLEVFGDRTWRGVGASKPRPFTEMPLDWAHAYGGPEFARNPLGKGARRGRRRRRHRVAAAEPRVVAAAHRLVRRPARAGRVRADRHHLAAAQRARRHLRPGVAREPVPGVRPRHGPRHPQHRPARPAARRRLGRQRGVPVRTHAPDAGRSSAAPCRASAPACSSAARTRSASRARASSPTSS